MTTLHVLRVFVGPNGRGGNPLGVVLDGPAVPEDGRQAVAHELGFSETVFVDERTDAFARIRIFTPAAELPFAGHPTVGTSWLLRAQGTSAKVLRVPAGDVHCWQSGELSWIRARPEWVHAFEVRQLASTAAVDGFEPPAMGEPGVYVWAWQDETTGHLRSRYFPTDYGIVEDEATGAAAVLMGHRIGRPITIHQGVGSVLHVRPDQAEGTVDVGGCSELVETRALEG